MKQRIENKVMKIPEWLGSVYSLIVHTVLFILAFILILLDFDFNKVLLTLTTIVSIEAIYLSIFIQMSVNRNSKDIDEIQEDIEEIAEDIEEIQEDVDEIEEDIDEMVEEDRKEKRK